MKKLLKYSLLVLFVAGVLSSCMNKNARKNNYPAPDITPPPVGRVYTIDTLLRIWQDAGSPSDYANADIFKNEDCSVYGIITADENSGNLYKAAFIQNRASGMGIELYMKSVSGLRIGDSVRVCLKGATLGAYGGTPQIQNLEANKVIILDNCKYIDPEVITVPDITAHYHLCQLVTLNDVQFNDPSTVWAILHETSATSTASSRDLDQYDDDCNKLGTIVVRSSAYASFADRPLPSGKGSITGILTYFAGSGGIWQLIVRSYNEVQMDGERCE